MNKPTMCKLVAKSALMTGLCFAALSVHAATVTVDCDAGNTSMGVLGGVKPDDTVLVSGLCKEHVNIAPEITRVIPDLPARIKAKAPLNQPDANTFYTPGAKGYTDYPGMG